jgi:hypothetical protein
VVTADEALGRGIVDLRRPSAPPADSWEESWLARVLARFGGHLPFEEIARSLRPSAMGYVIAKRGNVPDEIDVYASCLNREWRLIVEAADDTMIDSLPEITAESAKSIGVRMGNWLSLKQAQTLLNAPDITTLEGAARPRHHRRAPRLRVAPVGGGGAYDQPHTAAGWSVVHCGPRGQAQPRADRADADVDQGGHGPDRSAAKTRPTLLTNRLCGRDKRRAGAARRHVSVPDAASLAVAARSRHAQKACIMAISSGFCWPVKQPTVFRFGLFGSPSEFTNHNPLVNRAHQNI